MSQTIGHAAAVMCYAVHRIWDLSSIVVSPEWHAGAVCTCAAGSHLSLCGRKESYDHVKGLGLQARSQDYLWFCRCLFFFFFAKVQEFPPTFICKMWLRVSYCHPLASDVPHATHKAQVHMKTDLPR